VRIAATIGKTAVIENAKSSGLEKNSHITHPWRPSIISEFKMVNLIWITLCLYKNMVTKEIVHVTMSIISRAVILVYFIVSELL